MRSSLVLLAALAGSALAYPTDMAVERRTLKTSEQGDTEAKDWIGRQKPPKELTIDW
jgi:hypothetical protein